MLQKKRRKIEPLTEIVYLLFLKIIKAKEKIIYFLSLTAIYFLFHMINNGPFYIK